MNRSFWRGGGGGQANENAGKLTNSVCWQQKDVIQRFFIFVFFQMARMCLGGLLYVMYFEIGRDAVCYSRT